MVYPIIYRFSTILLVVDFFHPQCSRATFLAPAQYPPWALFLGQCSGSQAGWHMMALYEKYGGFLGVTHFSSPFFGVNFVHVPWKPPFLPSRMGMWIHPACQLEAIHGCHRLSRFWGVLELNEGKTLRHAGSVDIPSGSERSMWVRGYTPKIWPEIWYVYVPP